MLGECAFEDCPSITEITVSTENTTYRSNENCIITIEGGALVLGCQTSIIPNDGSIKSIHNNAFSSCIRLTEITIPESVTSIGDYAFQGTSLSSVIIPDSVTHIGIAAFRDCQLLESAVLPSNLTTISELMFYECTSLSSITIPASVTTIDMSAFTRCALTSITIPEKVEHISTFAFLGCPLKRVVFENPDGWIIYLLVTQIDGTDISSSQLSNQFSAANLLKNTYSDRYWQRKTHAPES